MKNKDYLNLLKNGGILTINKYCYLKRWTSSFGEEVDCLAVVFSIHHYADYVARINSRDIEGIKREIAEHQTKAFSRANEKLIYELGVNYD